MSKVINDDDSDFINEMGMVLKELEGGEKIVPIVKSLVKNKIPVMGHVGILPQTDKKFTFKGKKIKEYVEFI